MSKTYKKEKRVLFAGEKYSKLTVIKSLGCINKTTKQPMYLCECECGNYAHVDLYALVNGKTKSCGCLHRNYAYDDKSKFIGKKYGRLTVIDYAKKSRDGNTVFLCKCDCGTIKEIKAHSVVHGTIKSCGCFRREMAAERNRQRTGTKLKKPSICFDCQRSAAPPELACVWDRSKATYPPLGASYVVSSIIGNGGKKPITIVSIVKCPLFLPMEKREKYVENE